MSDSLIVGGETGRWGEGEGSSAAGGGGKIVKKSQVLFQFLFFFYLFKMDDFY